MNMCIDAIGVSLLPGTSHYAATFGLIESLLEMYPQPNYHFIWDKQEENFKWKNQRNNITLANMGNRGTEQYLKNLETYLKSEKITLFHSINNGFSILPNKLCKNISTVNDLSPIVCSEYVDVEYYNKFISIFPDVIKNSDKLVAISNHIKNDLIKYFKVPEKKIEVIYPSYLRNFMKRDNKLCKRELSEKYGIDKEFLLYAGSIHPRKNLDLVMDVFAKVKKEINDIMLVFAGNYCGKRNKYYLYLKEKANSLGIEKDVVFLGIVEHQEMSCFFNTALCLFNLSEYDGFPLVTLESLACNCPVLCINKDTLEGLTENKLIYLCDKDSNNIKNVVLKFCERSFRVSLNNINNKIPEQFNHEIGLKNIVRVYESTAYNI